MFPEEIESLAREVVERARERGLRIVTAESCTGGLVAGAICAVPGASDVFERGFVTYSNRAKQEILGVPGDLIADLGAVSQPVAERMAEGALQAAHAHISVAVTGIAGPGGGTPLKPVGAVFLASARINQSPFLKAERFPDEGRTAIQLRAVQSALELLRDQMS